MEKPYIATEISDAHSVEKNSKNEDCPFFYQLLSWFCCIFHKIIIKQPNSDFDFAPKSDDKCYFVRVGSLAEGTFLPSKSDSDFMRVSNCWILCDHEETMEIQTDKNIYVADRYHASPGYTLVRMSINTENPLDIKNAKCLTHCRSEMVEINGEEHGPSLKYSFHELVQKLFQVLNIVFGNKINTENPLDIDQSKLVNHFRSKVAKINEEEHGPSEKYLFNEILQRMFQDLNAGFLQKSTFDVVFAIPFLGKSDLRKWLNRRRYFDWPSCELQQEIFGMLGYVVPVGHRGSEYESIEWRICYTTAETKLIRSWNDVQRLLYIEIKQFVYQRVQAICPDITSYIIKNLMFWIAESVPGKYFKFGNFLPLFRSTLHVLKRCVERKYLPNYMIPERNLFDGKLEDCDKNGKLNDLLSYWITTCPIFNQDKNSFIIAGALIKGLKSEPEFLAWTIRVMRLHKKFVETFFKECLEEPTEEKQIQSMLKFKRYKNIPTVIHSILNLMWYPEKPIDSDLIKELVFFSLTFCSILRRLLHKSTATTTTIYQRV